MSESISLREARSYVEILKRRQDFLIARKDDLTRTDLSYIRAEIPALTYAITLMERDIETRQESHLEYYSDDWR